MEFIMIRNDYIELQKIFEECDKFIRSVWMYTEGEDKNDYHILKSEVNALSDKANEIIIKLDAFEQNRGADVLTISRVENVK